jgi:hypothetical protein
MELVIWIFSFFHWFSMVVIFLSLLFLPLMPQIFYCDILPPLRSARDFQGVALFFFFLTSASFFLRCVFSIPYDSHQFH